MAPSPLSPPIPPSTHPPSYSCRLLSSRMALLKLKDTGEADTIRRHLRKLLNALDWLIELERTMGDSMYSRMMGKMNK